MARKKLGAAQKREGKLRKMALVIVEVARATNEGHLPLTQVQIQKLIRGRWRVRLALSTLSGYVASLEEGKKDGLQRPWLQTQGQGVYLASEEKTLTDSLCIGALILAVKLSEADDDRHFHIDTWVQKCRSLKLTTEKCKGFLEDYRSCGYLFDTPSGNGRGRQYEQLNTKAINGDMFYLNQALKAKLRKQVQSSITRPTAEP